MNEFTEDQVIDAVKSFIAFGEIKMDPHNGSYFGGEGWAATCLRWHLVQLETANGSYHIFQATSQVLNTICQYCKQSHKKHIDFDGKKICPWPVSLLPTDYPET